jgi:hypothetical protein
MSNAIKKHASRVTGLVLIALLVLLGMAGANPDLHQMLHTGHCHTGGCDSSSDQHSDDIEHICGVTLLQTGAVFLIEPPVFKCAGSVRERAECFKTAVFAGTSLHVPQGRAPPVVGIV